MKVEREYGPFRLTVEGPDVAEAACGAMLPTQMNLRPKAETEARELIEALGGYEAFKAPDSTDRAYGTIETRDGRVQIWLPSGEPRLPAFVAEVYRQQEAADRAAQEEEENGERDDARAAAGDDEYRATL